MITNKIHNIEEYSYNRSSKTKTRNIARNISDIAKWKMVKTNVDGIGDITLGLHINLQPFLIAYIDSTFSGKYVRKPSFEIKLYCSKKTHESLNKLEFELDKTIYKEILQIPQYGEYHIDIKSHQLFFDATIKQQTVIEDISKYYENPLLSDVKYRKICVAYLYGPPGTGKSMIGKFLAHKYHATYCKINPTHKDDISIKYLYHVCTRKDFRNLVISLDDYDKILLEMVKNNKSTKSKNDDKYSEVYDLASHNALFDTIRSMNNIIVLITANKSPKEVCNNVKELDRSCDSSVGSLFRKGRIDMIIPFDSDDIIHYSFA